MNEDQDKDTMRGIQHIVSEFEDGKYILVTSAITEAEILESRNGSDKMAVFRRVFLHPHLQRVACDHIVINWATQIRNDLIRIKSSGMDITVSTPDAIHVASALRGACSKLYTMDGKNNRERLERKLLNLGNYSFQGRQVDIVPPPTMRLPEFPSDLFAPRP